MFKRLTYTQPFPGSEVVGSLKNLLPSLPTVRHAGGRWAGVSHEPVRAYTYTLYGQSILYNLFLTALHDKKVTNDPEVRKILEDFPIIEAVNSGATEAFICNPKFMKLLDNPAIKGISDRIVEWLNV